MNKAKVSAIYHWFFPNNKAGKILVLAMLIMPLLILWGCEDKDADVGFNAGFSFTYLENNRVLFENESTGEYYSLTWDFGNGETTTTTDKNKSHTIYYPSAGEYPVSLKVLNYVGDTKTSNKTISIQNDDLVVSFSLTPDPEEPNYVNLENTTIGNYDSFKWLYRNRVIEDEPSFTAWFPFSGQYEVELRVYKDSDSLSLKKPVTITRDDPDYGSKLSLVWSDEFDGATVNPDNWSFETGASGWGNNELQNYTSSGNAELTDGKLIITAKKVNDNKEVGSYTSARIKTESKIEFQYGRMEIRAKLPSGTGVWPAIWMLGSNFRTAGWPACGEMDIMEYVGYLPNTVHSTVHTPSGFGANGNGSSKILETAEEEFHIYGLLWTEKKLVFYTDTPENITHTYAPSTKNAENWPFDQPHFFLLNLAVGGSWGGAMGIDNTIFPQTMEIDYVRVYQEAR